MRLEQRLVLNRYLHHLFGADGLESLKQALSAVVEGPSGDGQSHFFHALAGRRELQVPVDDLRDYDTRIVDYEARLGRSRGGLKFRYFQYLALLYTEVLLDRLTRDPSALVAEVNGFLERLQRQGRLAGFPRFEVEDLRRLAFFLATGAGKTLLLHANLWQVEHYLRHGRRPDALVRRADGRREFGGIYLITPNEGLSQQHLEEFALSAIEASHLVHDPAGLPSLFGPRVQVVEISKLADTATGDGVSVPVEALGTANLVFVDEGHKGVGTEAQTWKTRQKQISAEGLLLEYSATFAQAVGAASRRVKESLLEEYGKSIVFDYSYRHFYHENFGKDFEVLNLESVNEDQAHDLLLGGLLMFYQQVHVYRAHGPELHRYRIEPPLWVFLGSKVNAVFTRGGQRRSDVATAVEFLRRFLEDREWAVRAIGQTMAGESGLHDPVQHEDVFKPRLGHLFGAAEDLYTRICRDVFHGRGGLGVLEIKGADGELGLRASTPDHPDHPYFGVINIGDVSPFKALLEQTGMEVREDHFTGSLFGDVNRADSSVNILIGAKKFVEGWSSWRVSTMGLLNMGRGEGSQVIQLFGRGVRLRGRDRSLRRSAARRDPDPAAPTVLRQLETLTILGWNADYLAAFQAMLDQEELQPPVEIPVRRLFDDVAELPVPRTREGYSAAGETWVLAADPNVRTVVDLTSRAAVLAGGAMRAIDMGETREISFADGSPYLGLVDPDALLTSLLEYKTKKGYRNLFVARSALAPILARAVVRMDRKDLKNPGRVQNAAERALTSYVDRFVASRERAAESLNLTPGVLRVQERIPTSYTVRVGSEELLARIQALLADPPGLYADGGMPLPRLHFDRHLWSPLLLKPAEQYEIDLQISPPGLEEGEEQFIKDLRSFWADHHGDPEFTDRELFVLRNLPGSGVGFFQRSDFFPDFILWLTGPDGGTRVRFVEPHGMHHGGLEGNADKSAAFHELWRLNTQADFQTAGLDVGGYLVTQTALADIPGAQAKTWSELREACYLLPQHDDYIATVLAEAGPANAGENNPPAV